MEILFNWNDQKWLGNSGASLFEELCFDVLSALDYKNLKWQQGSGDRGRDIECENFRIEPDGRVTREKWFVECKRYESGVNVMELQSKIAWADAESPDYLLFIISSHLTPDTKDWIKKIEGDKKYQIRYWERKDLENQIQKIYAQIPNIEKYFLTIEEDLNVLYRKFYVAKQLLKERRLEQIKVLEDAIAGFNDPTKQRELAEKYKNLSLIKKDLKEFNQAVDDLNKARGIYEQIGESEAIFDIILLKGDIELEQNRGLFASQLYDEAYRLATTIDNLQLKSFSKYKAGLALHSTYTINNFQRALQAYQEAIRLYPEKEVSINLKIAEFYLDFEKYQEFNEIITNLNATDKESIIDKNLVYVRYLLDQHEWDKAKTLLEQTKALIDTSNQELLLDVLMKTAYTEWKKANYNEAITLLRGQCIPLIDNIQDEERLMVIYKNISYIMQERSSVESKFDADLWTEHNKWVDISNRLEKRYERAQLKALYAEENINQNKFPDALSNLRQSKKFYGDLNSWTGEVLLKEKEALLAVKTGNLELALWRYIELGDKDRIENIAAEIIKTADKQRVADLLSMLLNIQSATIKEQIGLCHSIGMFYDVIPDDLIDLALDKLFVFLELSHTENNALQCLANFVNRLSSENVKQIVEKILPFISDETKHWNTKEAAVDLLNGLAFIMNEEIKSKAVANLCSQIDMEVQKEREGKISNVAHMDVALTNIAKKSPEEIKNKAVETLKTQPIRFKRLGYLHYLGIKVTPESIEDVINKTIQNITDRIVIHDINSPTPKMDNILFITSITLNETTKVTVGTNPEMDYLQYIIDDIPENSLSNLIDAHIRMISNEHNTLFNKEQLLYNLGLFANRLPATHLERVIDMLIAYSSGMFEISPIDKSAFELSSSPFSAYKINSTTPNDLISVSLRALSKFYRKMNDDKKEIFRTLIWDLVKHENEKIRLSCAQCFSVLENVDMDLSVTLYSLLFDEKPLVRAWTIDSFCKIGIDKLTPPIVKNLLREMEEFTSKDRDKDTMMATAFFVKKFHEQIGNFNEGFQEVSTRLKNNLLNSKYFSVRAEV